MDPDDLNTLQVLTGVLLKRLGGSVRVTQAEVDSVHGGQVHIMVVDGDLVFSLVEENDRAMRQ